MKLSKQIIYKESHDILPQIVNCSVGISPVSLVLTEPFMCIVLLLQIAKDSLLTCEYYFFYGGEYRGDRTVLFRRNRASFFFLIILKSMGLLPS